MSRTAPDTLNGNSHRSGTDAPSLSDREFEPSGDSSATSLRGSSLVSLLHFALKGRYRVTSTTIPSLKKYKGEVGTFSRLKEDADLSGDGVLLVLEMPDGTERAFDLDEVEHAPPSA